MQLNFELIQHLRDEELLRTFTEHLGCGYLKKHSDSAIVFRVTKFEDIEKIILLFQKYPIHGVKHLDYLDWCKVAELMQNKAHLTKEGLEQIGKIKDGMNKKRKN